jgi:AbrB family looped-hinge helix DNA binding protein
VRITSKGQVTIPAEVRRQAGLLPHMEVDVEFDGRAVRIVRAVGRKKGGRGARIVAHLRGSANVGMTTDEIIALMRGE